MLARWKRVVLVGVEQKEEKKKRKIVRVGRSSSCTIAAVVEPHER